LQARPTSFPAFPPAILSSTVLVSRVEELAKLCSVSSFYNFAEPASSPIAAVPSPVTPVAVEAAGDIAPPE
jgi:hypothetical protein